MWWVIHDEQYLSFHNPFYPVKSPYNILRPIDDNNIIFDVDMLPDTEAYDVSFTSYLLWEGKRRRKR